jgi:hypothetical protein
MSFKAYTFNVQHGQGTDGNFNFQRQIDAMAGAELFAIQERSGSETGWNTPMSNAGMAEAIYRPNQIGGSDGCAIWYKSSAVTVLNTYECQLSLGAVSPWDGIPTNVDKSAVAAKVQVEGQKFYFVSTHLCQNAGADSNGGQTSVIREGQIRTLLTFMDQNLLGLDIVVAADFNYTPGMLLVNGGFQMDLFLRAGFVDLWRVGMANGTATAPWQDLDGTGGPDQVVSDNIITHDTRPRIDGIYQKTINRALTMTGISVPDMRVTCSVALTGDPLFCPDTSAGQRAGNMLDWGVRPTDHCPVEATFSVNQQAASPVRRTNFSWMPNVTV